MKFIFFLIITSHQLVYNVERQGKAFVICINYADNTPFSYEYFEIFSPVDNEMPFEVGNLDKNGCFAFLPDTGGVWKIKAWSEDGHGVELKVKVNTSRDFNVSTYKDGRCEFFKFFGGILLIFLFFGILKTGLKRNAYT